MKRPTASQARAVQRNRKIQGNGNEQVIELNRGKGKTSKPEQEQPKPPVSALGMILGDVQEALKKVGPETDLEFTGAQQVGRVLFGLAVIAICDAINAAAMTITQEMRQEEAHRIMRENNER